MTKRARPSLAVDNTKQSYFVADKGNIRFVPTGCTLLNCALGGGYPLGRVVNIVGDRSTAKTALATEALINFVRSYPDGAAAYRDAEAAFDTGYAAAMGLPLESINFGNLEEPLTTIEAFARDFEAFLDTQIKRKKPGIYVLDSLDSLSDENEIENDIGKATFGMAKAKALSVMFRKLTRKIEQSGVLLIIVSQVRENIGVSFGEKYRRAGGKALDFYASQIFWLANAGALRKVINRIERVYGVAIKAKVKKNKVALPFREVEFDFIFGYGVEDLGASLEWLKSIERYDVIGKDKLTFKAYLASIENMNDAAYQSELKLVSAAVKNLWAEIETSFLPKRTKYA